MENNFGLMELPGPTEKSDEKKEAQVSIFAKKSAVDAKDSKSSKSKKRSKDKSAKKKKKSKKRKRSESDNSSDSDSDSSSSDSSSGSSSDSGSSNSDSDSDAKKKSKSKKRKGKKSKKKSKESKKRKNKKDKKKKGKKKSKKPKHSVYSMNDQWGKYGTVNSTDYHSKLDEFYAWLYEIKHIDRMSLNQREEKSYFAEYAEDFNTGTFPDEKYYDLAKWQSTQLSKGISEFDDPNLRDEDRVRLERAKAKADAAAQADRVRVMAMKQKLQTDRDFLLDAKDRQFAGYVKPTFESIAKERAQKKEAQERAYRYA